MQIEKLIFGLVWFGFFFLFHFLPEIKFSAYFLKRCLTCKVPHKQIRNETDLVKQEISMPTSSIP